jgi:hypothetical protein
MSGVHSEIGAKGAKLNDRARNITVHRANRGFFHLDKQLGLEKESLLTP